MLLLMAQHVWAQEVLPKQDDLASFWDYLANEYFPWLQEGWDKTHGLTERGLNVADPNDVIPDIAATIIVAVITTMLAAFVIVRLVKSAWKVFLVCAIIFVSVLVGSYLL